MIRFCFLVVSFISINTFAQDIKMNMPINTGVNMTVAILDVGTNIQRGDTILALYKLDNDYVIGGLTVWKGERLAIALWGDDSTSELKDGFSDQEDIKWIRRKDKQDLALTPDYRVGQNKWKANGISIIENLSILK